MVDKKISELTSASQLVGTETIPVVKGGKTLSATINQIVPLGITSAETTAGVTPTNYEYPEGHAFRYGATGDGSTDDSSALNDWLSVNADLYAPAGTYKCSGLTHSNDNQIIKGDGAATIFQKNANGTLFSSTADRLVLKDLQFRGDAATPTFTGNNVSLTGDNVVLDNCGSRWAYARAVISTGQHIQIRGTCDLYQSALQDSATEYDIEIGVSGTATLYHQITNIYTSQVTGGIHFIDTGGTSVIGSQFGQAFVDAGTAPAGVNGGSWAANRILGDVDVEISNSSWSANQFNNITITFVSGTSGHSLDNSNRFGAGYTITDDSNQSSIFDPALATRLTYTPTWDAASSSPTIGNGSISGHYYKVGKLVFVSIFLTIGSTTNTGTGVYTFTLPIAPSDAGSQCGGAKILDSGTTNYIGIPITDSGGSAIVRVQTENAGNVISNTVPMTWATGDTLELSVTYLTN